MSWAVSIVSWFGLTLVLTVVGIVLWLQLSHLRFIQYHRHKSVQLPPLTAVAFIALHAREVWAWVVLGGWTFIGVTRDGWRIPPSHTGPPVLCVHGFTQNGSNFWGLRKRLFRAGRASRALYLGRPLQPLAGYAVALTRVMRTLDEPVDVVCHSMGGVILRIVLDESPELRAKVRRIVTLGSPHRGTAGPRGFGFASDIRELSRKSPVLAELPLFDSVADHVEVTTIAAVRDFIVYPISSALLDGANQWVLPGLGHGGLLVYSASLNRVVDALLSEPELP
jgi:pimeloyl-ACP methyl ester carboxylesterase